MLPSESLGRSAAERRSTVRHDCIPDTTGWVTDFLEQGREEAGTWNLSTGGAGLVLGSLHTAGVRLVIELHHPECENVLVASAEVAHTICCPSFNEMWLTGCSFLDPVERKEVQPFV